MERLLSESVYVTKVLFFTHHTRVVQPDRAGRQDRRGDHARTSYGDPTTGYGIFIENMLANMARALG